MRRSLPPWLRVLAALLLSAALVMWVGPSEVRERLAALPLLVVLSGVGTALLSQWIGAIRLRLAARTQGLGVTVREAFSINLSAVFYGLFLPGGSVTGWAVRLIRMSRQKADVGAAVLALASDRLCATASLAMIGLVADPLLGSRAGAALLALLAAVAATTALLAVGLFGLLPFKIAPMLRRVWAARWMRSPAPTLDRLNGGTRVVALTSAMVLSLCMHIIGVAIWFVLARALGIDLNVLVIAWVRSAAMVVALLPVSIGGLGLREGAAIYLLSFFGVTPADALSLSLAVFAATVLGVGLVGGAGEAWRLSALPRSSPEL